MHTRSVCVKSRCDFSFLFLASPFTFFFFFFRPRTRTSTDLANERITFRARFLYRYLSCVSLTRAQFDVPSSRAPLHTQLQIYFLFPLSSCCSTRDCQTTKRTVEVLSSRGNNTVSSESSDLQTRKSLETDRAKCKLSDESAWQIKEHEGRR